MSETLLEIPRPTAEDPSSRDGEGLPIRVARGVRRKRIVIVGAGFGGIAAGICDRRC